MLEESAAPLLRRLTQWLTPFRACFGHEAQRISLGKYVNGLLSDSPRKSMEAMLSRVLEPVRYQSFQQFITDAPWEAEDVWQVLRKELPEREGMVVLDDTGFPKKGDQSVGVKRQYTGTLGKIANCQVAVTANFWTAAKSWLIGATLYLPKEWTEDPKRREKARIPDRVHFQEKWQLALQLLRDAIASGLQVRGVLADSGYGDATAFRAALHEMGLIYAVGISSITAVFRGTPRIIPAKREPKEGAQRVSRPRLPRGVRAIQVSKLASTFAESDWRRVTWRNGENAPRAALFVALRVTPSKDWYKGLAPEVWLLCERSIDANYDDKFFLIHLPSTAQLQDLVEFAHQRWAIEQQYQQLKTELGLDHFEGRTYTGWNHHMALSAVTYAFLQRERMKREVTISFETIRAIVREIFTGLIFASNPRYMQWLAEARELLPLRL